ncbi:MULTISPECIES: ribulose-phosphate 3-epimerase [Enterococcus]|uniref:Ribulose-phosphate 3-epimerase n=1 Tax=Enterococcus alishanensis TaxID=1303817 RepID=A0ABS6TH36_9ENTE|nr:ribulose-phosphate 3-epimerase [Enterococcus alishanensis]MBV7392266.1 ribulose-phosphate 3-epimerase [Enterococcus alishanensis]
MMEKIMCPSMMCANFAALEKEVVALDQAGTDIFHLDFMDGQFVPNFAMGIQDLETIRKSTNKLVDVHLMIENPGRYVEKFAEMGVDIIYVHPESDPQITRTLDLIKNQQKKVGIAINPGTSVATIHELLPLVDYVMVMTVNPGFSGQKYLPFVDKKILELTALKADYAFKVMVDGAISPEKIEQLSKIGVDGFVLGTSALFNKDQSYEAILTELKK